MPKVKVPKSSPSIDMTPMVDLAFLLVTFFMLAASFRNNEPFTISSPSSIADEIVPENVITVSVDQGGRVFFNMTGAEARKEALGQMAAKYKLKLTGDRAEQFSYMTSFGCTMREMSGYLNVPAEERARVNTKGIPTDSTNNELKDWIYFGNIAALNSGKTLYEEAKLKGGDPDPNDFKPKFVLNVDNKTLYVHAQRVIDVFRDLNLNNLNFITTSEMPPANM